MARRPTFVRRVAADERLTIVEHLDELRRRILVSAVALVVSFAGLYAVHSPLMRFLRRPLPSEQDLITLAVSEAFFTVLKVTFWCSVILALPVWLYQLYAFVVPAVADQPRRRVLAVVGAISALFLAGAAFGFFVVLPVALDWLLGFGDDLFANQLRAGDYYGFVTSFTLASGLMFEVPVAMLGLARLGVCQASTYIRHWRTAIVVIAVFAALLPGGDVVSMLLLMVPQVGLYLLGIQLARMFGQPAPWRREAWTDEAAGDGSGDPPAHPS